MMKTGRKKILILVGTILMCLAIVLIVKLVNTENIQHYKQYLFPGRGQVVYCPEYPQETEIVFYFYDEEKISEMSSADNFKKITLTTDGNPIEAVSWTVEDDENVYELNRKRLTVHVKPERECVIKGIEIQYVDKTEVFDAGEILVRAIESGFHLNLLWVSEGFSDMRPGESDFPEDILRSPEFTMMEIHVLSNNYGDVTLEKIDFGISDWKVDMSSFKEVPSGIIEYSKYTKSKIYGVDRDLLEATDEGQIPIQQLQDSTQQETFVASICRNLEQNDIVSYYINPIYQFRDSEGAILNWANTSYTAISMPDAAGERSIAQIRQYLESDGV